ncbi:MAG TPA: M28 family peptidase [Gammaproteobacteria bacterium]
MNRFALLLGAALALPAVAAPEKPADAPAIPALPEPAPLSELVRENVAALQRRAADDPRAYDIVASLTTEVGPRLAGTSGDRAAVAWALTKLRELGFRNVHAESVEVPHWERGALEAAILEPFPQTLRAVSLGGSIGTPSEGITAPLVTVADLDELATLKPADVRGRIVYINGEMETHRDGSGYGKAVGKRTRGAIEAAKLGAVGVVIRSVGTDNNRIAHTGMMRYEDGVRRIPAIAISNPDADMLDRQVASGREVIFHMTSSARYLPNEMSANVVGEIPGREKPEEIVLLGAHLDSWDVGTGAHDDAAGVGIVTAAARLIGDLRTPPKRTVRVVLFANEEFGLSGAKAYAVKHADELDRHVLAMEADFGAGRVWQFASRVAEESLPLVAAIHSQIEPLGIQWSGNKAYGGADIGPIRELGVPVVQPGQDGTLYFDVHHTDNDTLDKIDPIQLNQNVAVYATAAYIAAMAEGDFGRLEVTSDE